MEEEEEDFSGSEGSSASQTNDNGELDAIFFHCDIESTGLVPVSRLVEHLKEAITSGSSEECLTTEIQSLKNLLDPDCEDIQIDKETFESAVLKFMESVYNNNNESLNISANIPEEKCQTPVNCLKTRLGTLVGLTPNNSPRMSLFNTSLNNFAARDSMLNQSIETTGMASGERQHFVQQEVDVGELINRLETIQFHNKKISEENSGLKEQLVISEETTAQLSQKIEQLTKEAKSHQSTVEKLQEIRQESEDLKISVTNLIEEKKELKMKIRQLEKDNSSLESSRLELECQVCSLAADLENTRKAKKELQTSLTEHRKMLSEVESIAAAQGSQLIEESTKVKELEKTVKDFNKVNETLRQEKTDLEMQLNHTQHELTSLRLKSEKIKLNGSDDLEDLNEEEFMPVLGLAPTASSTPFNSKMSSLCSELVHRIQDDPCLPSPLCEKELEVVVENIEDDLEQDIIKSTYNLNKMCEKAPILLKSGCVLTNNLEIEPSLVKPERLAAQLKKGEVGSDFSSINLDSPVRTPDTGQAFAFSPNPDIERCMLKKQIFQYSKTVESVKKAADKRIIVLREKLRKLTEENRELKDDYQVAQQDLKIEAHLKLELQEKVSKLNEEIKSERIQKGVIYLELTDCKKSMCTLEEDLKESKQNVINLISKQADFKSKVHQLESTKDELIDLYQKSEVHIDQLKDDLNKCSLEKKSTIHCLEDEIRTLHLHRQIDMKELWKIVHNDSFSGNTELEIDASATRIIREQVTQEIENLRTQLAKSQLALTALQTKALPQLTLHLTQKERIDNRSSEDINSSPKIQSPLVEALTLDSLTKQNNQNYVHHNLTGHISIPGNPPPWASKTSLKKSDSSSCPDFDELDYNKKIQPKRAAVRRKGYVNGRTPFVGITQYAVTNVSTGSSTSGVEISSTSTRSDTLLNRKNNNLFIDNVYSPDSLSSTEDVPQEVSLKKKADNEKLNALTNILSPMTRMRSPSFKHAIERGPSGDSGISNPSQDQNISNNSLNIFTPREEDLLPHESDLIKVGLYTDKNRANLCVSSFRSGYYDRKGVHVPEHDDWNSNIDGYYEDNDHLYSLEGYNSADEMYKYQGQGLNSQRLDGAGNSYSNHTSVTGAMNNLHDDRTLSPGTIRRLSILPEKEESLEAEEINDKIPVPPPRKSKYKLYVKADKWNDGRQSISTEGTGQSSVSLVAHFKPLPCGDSPVHTTELKQSYNSHTTQRPCDRSPKNGASVPNYADPPPYPQAMEFCKKEAVPKENPPYRPPSKTYQLHESSMNHSPPPPYRNPLNKAESDSSKPHYVGETSDNQLTDTTTKSVINQCDNRECTNVINSYDETESRASDSRDTDLEINVNSQIVNNKQEVQLTDRDEKEQQLSLKDEQKKHPLKLIHKQNDLDRCETFVVTNVGQEQSELRLEGEKKQDIASTTAIMETILEATNGNKDMQDKSGKTIVCENRGMKLSSVSKAKTVDEGKPVDNVETVKAIDSGKSSKDQKLSQDVKIYNEVDIKQEILRGLEDNKVTQVTDPTKFLKGNELAKVREEYISKKKLIHEGSKMLELVETQTDTEEREDNSPNNDPEFSNTNKTDNDVSSLTLEGRVFPSLTDKVLAKWGLKRNANDPMECPDNLTEKEVEDQYVNMVLAFKSDKQTLDQRVDLQQRARDTTEENIQREMTGLLEAMKALEPFCNDMKSREIYASIEKHVEVLTVSNNRLTSRAEILGASKQEFRLSRAVDVMVKHVENLKRMYEIEHSELEETKKLLAENKLLPAHMNEKRFTNITPSNKNSRGVRRRASVAVLRSVPNMGMDQSQFPPRFDPKSFLKHIDNSSTTHTSTVPVGPTFVSTMSPTTSRRASIAVHSTTSDMSSPYTSASFMQYRSNRISSTSSEESLSSRNSRNSVFEDQNDFRVLMQKTNKKVIEDFPVQEHTEKYLEEDGDSNNNTNQNNNNEDSETGKIRKEMSNLNKDVIIEEDLHEGLTDDRKLSMSQSSEVIDSEKKLMLEDKIKTMIERQDTFEANVFENKENIIEKFKDIADWDELKLRVRYTAAGLIFLLGFINLMIALIPKTDATERNYFQGHIWTSVGEILWPFITLQHNAPPPT